MKPQFSKNETAAIIGRTVMLEERCEWLESALESATRQIAEHEEHIAALCVRVDEMTRPRTFLTCAQAAELLGLSQRTLRRWREDVNPRIPFILLEGGDVRYRAEAIESYLSSRERGASRRLRSINSGLAARADNEAERRNR